MSGGSDRQPALMEGTKTQGFLNDHPLRKGKVGVREADVISRDYRTKPQEVVDLSKGKGLQS